MKVTLKANQEFDLQIPERSFEPRPNGSIDQQENLQTVDPEFDL